MMTSFTLTLYLHYGVVGNEYLPKGHLSLRDWKIIVLLSNCGIQLNWWSFNSETMVMNIITELNYAIALNDSLSIIWYCESFILSSISTLLPKMPAIISVSTYMHAISAYALDAKMSDNHPKRNDNWKQRRFTFFRCWPRFSVCCSTIGVPYLDGMQTLPIYSRRCPPSRMLRFRIKNGNSFYTQKWPRPLGIPMK